MPVSPDRKREVEPVKILAPGPLADDGERERRPASPVTVTLLLVIGLLSAMLLSLAIPDSSGGDAGSAVSPAAADSGLNSLTGYRPPTPEEVAQREARAVEAWRDLPGDHDAHVSGRPGSGQPILGYLTYSSVIYVNSIGRPTVIDLDTGFVSELDVAPTRPYDVFAVEAGRVVTVDTERRNLPQATERAVLFQVYREPSVVSSVDWREPALCLQSACGPMRWDQATLSNDVDSVTLLDPSVAPDVAALFTGWTPDRRWLVESPADDAVRIPAPGDGRIWVVRQIDPQLLVEPEGTTAVGGHLRQPTD